MHRKLALCPSEPIGKGEVQEKVNEGLSTSDSGVEAILGKGKAYVRDFKFEDFVEQGGYLVVAQVALLLAIVTTPGEAIFQQFGVLAIVTGAITAGLGVTGIGANNFTALPSPSKESTLTTTGIYGLVRHPMYSGLLLLTFGFAAATNNVARAIFACLLSLVLIAKVEKEEEELTALHSEYTEYKKRVTRLVPYIY